MNLRAPLNKEKGFTIIEVMIVLAIAGLIILVVFLAVPAVQRGSRNSSRKSDISNLLGAIAEFSSNNKGEVPNSAAEITTLRNGLDLGFYVPSRIHYRGRASTATNNPPTTGAFRVDTTEDQVLYYYGTECVDGSTNGQFTRGSLRQSVVIYALETSGNDSLQCQEI